MNKFEFYEDTIPSLIGKRRWTPPLSETSMVFRINNWSIINGGGRIRSFSEIKYYIADDTVSCHRIQNIARDIFCISKLKGRRYTKSIRGVADENK